MNRLGLYYWSALDAEQRRHNLEMDVEPCQVSNPAQQLPGREEAGLGQYRVVAVLVMQRSNKEDPVLFSIHML